MADGFCGTVRGMEGRTLAGRIGDLAIVAGALGLAAILILVGA